MTTIIKKYNTPILKHNAKLLHSFTKSLEDAGDTLANKKVTGFMLVLNYEEDVKEGDKTETVKSYSLHTLGDIQDLLKNAEYGVARAALRVRQDLLNKDRRYH